MGRDVLVAALAAALFACSPAKDDAEVDPARRWTFAEDALDRVPLCVWGASASDVWIGGGGLATGKPTLVRHWDGSAWSDVPVDTGGAPSTSTVWWIHGTQASDVWAVGEHGLAMRWDGSVWKAVPTGTTATLYGVFAASASDAWAVGGSPTGPGPNDVLLRWDGTSWSAVAPPTALGATYFKVWGSSASDVHVVGQSGLALHWNGAALEQVPTGVSVTLFTVHGRGAKAHAIGGAPPTLLSWDGAAWEPVGLPPRASGILSGVWDDASGTTFVVGEALQRYRVDADGLFTDDADHSPGGADLHAVWGDGAGNAFAVGGNYVALGQSGATPKGVVARFGP